MATLHVFVDESGNFDFSRKGSRFFIFTAVWTYNPAPMAARFSELRYRLIKEGHFRIGVHDDLAGFHAADDPRPRRDEVIAVLRSFADWNFASIVVEKKIV